MLDVAFFSDPAAPLAIEPATGLMMPLKDFLEWLTSEGLQDTLNFSVEMIRKSLREKTSLMRGPYWKTYESADELPKILSHAYDCAQDVDCAETEEKSPSSGGGSGEGCEPEKSSSSSSSASSSDAEEDVDVVSNAETKEGGGKDKDVSHLPVKKRHPASADSAAPARTVDVVEMLEEADSVNLKVKRKRQQSCDDDDDDDGDSGDGGESEPLNLAKKKKVLEPEKSKVGQCDGNCDGSDDDEEPMAVGNDSDEPGEKPATSKEVNEQWLKMCKEGKASPEGYKLVDGYLYPLKVVQATGGDDSKLHPSMGIKFGGCKEDVGEEKMQEESQALPDYEEDDDDMESDELKKPKGPMPSHQAADPMDVADQSEE